MQFPGEKPKTKASEGGNRPRSNCVNLSYVQMSALELTRGPNVRTQPPV